MTSKDVAISDEAGLHLRPAAEIVKAAAPFASTITLSVGERRADAKSILALLPLVLKQGMTVTITAEGADEAEAVATLAHLIGGAQA